MAAGSSTLPNETVSLKLPTGEMIDAVVPGGLSDADVKSYVQMKRPDLLGAPATGIKTPAQNTPLTPVDIMGKAQTAESATVGLPGYTGNRPVTNADLVPGAVVGGTAAAAMGGPAAVGAALPFVKTALKALPYVAASEGINYARQHLPGGKFIPPGAEMLPLFMSGGKEEPKPEPEPPNIRPPVLKYSTQQVPEAVQQRVPPPPVSYSINDIRAKAAAAPIEPEAIAADRYQEVRLTGPKVPAAQGANPQLPEMVSSPSTTIAKHGYDPGKQQMFITFKNGNTYRYSGVPQEVYDQYSQAESHGSFHANNIKGRYQTDLVSKGQQVSRALGQTLYGPASNAAFNRMNPPEDVPENWGVDYSPAVSPLDADKFAAAHQQARSELGPDAPMDQIITRRNQLAGGVPQGDVGSVVRGKIPSLPRGGKK